METGYTKADSANLPKMDSFMVANFFACNPDFLYRVSECKNFHILVKMELLDVMKNLTIKHTQNESEQKLFKSVAADIDNTPTEIVFAEYSDKTLLIVSQYQKIGSMLMIQRDQVHNPLGSNDIYSTKVIFGATGEEQQVAARYLAEAIKITKPLCIFINLKSYDIETVKACKDIILDLKPGQNN